MFYVLTDMCCDTVCVYRCVLACVQLRRCTCMYLECVCTCACVIFSNITFQEAMPIYKNLEKKIEVLNEFVQVCSEMKRACMTSDPLQEEVVHYSDLHKTLTLLK